MSSKVAQGFEDFFSLVGKCRWGEDFEPWKPQGRFGDFKCDGYHVPERTVFQCYAPQVVEPSNVASKIERDFLGARAHFGASMSKWVFVFNQKELNATAGLLLVKLRQDHPAVEIRTWLREDLFRLILALPDESLKILFPELLQDYRFDPSTEESLKKYVDGLNVPTPEKLHGQETGHNRGELHELLDSLSADDREIRRRLLGYSVWLSPLSKLSASQKLRELGYSEAAISSNLTRISQEGIVKITKFHILPVNRKICQYAADTLIDEFTESLDDI